jgi:hypothetical protein
MQCGAARRGAIRRVAAHLTARRAVGAGGCAELRVREGAGAALVAAHPPRLHEGPARVDLHVGARRGAEGLAGVAGGFLEG